MTLPKCHVVKQILFKLYSFVPASCFKPIKNKALFIHTHTHKNIHIIASYWNIKISIDSLRIESQKKSHCMESMLYFEFFIWFQICNFAQFGSFYGSIYLHTYLFNLFWIAFHTTHSFFFSFLCSSKC